MFYSFSKAIVRFVVFFMFRLKAVGTENVPKEGPAILAMNHRSNHDPIMAALTCPRQLRFMAKSELFEPKIFGGLIRKLGAFPVHRGKGDLAAIKAAFNIFKAGEVMLMFPEGGRVKNSERRKAKPGVALIAQKSGVPVIPVNLSGKYRFMNRITVTYGKPITFEQYKDMRMTGEEIQSLADDVLNKIYDLAV